MTATGLALAAQMAVSKGHGNATAENGPWIITLAGPSYRSINKAVKETGIMFRETVLALGGGKPPLQVFIDFRGLEPSPEPLRRFFFFFFFFLKNQETNPHDSSKTGQINQAFLLLKEEILV